MVGTSIAETVQNVQEYSTLPESERQKVQVEEYSTLPESERNNLQEDAGKSGNYKTDEYWIMKITKSTLKSACWLCKQFVKIIAVFHGS